MVAGERARRLGFILYTKDYIPFSIMIRIRETQDVMKEISLIGVMLSFEIPVDTFFSSFN
ncbi:hypothetical protein AT574_02745 [Phaeobacter inhibens]|nr:hypothetical protein AT574_02745 [Phaeobacter inhibens]